MKQDLVEKKHACILTTHSKVVSKLIRGLRLLGPQEISRM